MTTTEKMNVIYTRWTSLLLWFYIFTFIAHAHSQTHLNDVCDLGNGKQGQCRLFKDCPSAIELVRRQGRPTNCGFDGTQPIICCEVKSLLRAPTVGNISKQKCKETYNGLVYMGSSIISTIPKFSKPSNSSARRKRQAGIKGKTNVVGGFNSKPFQFPHMAALGFGEWPNVTWACGGSLISDKFVLTVGHCIESRELGRVKYIRLGDLDLKSTTDHASPQDVNISKIYKHPDYKPPSVYHDIALIRLASIPKMNNFVRPACLHTDTPIPDPNLIATGWGLTSYAGERADHLQQVTLKEFTFDECQKTFASTSTRKLKNGIDNKSQLCAGEAKKDTCQGDSGGPLQIHNVNYAVGYTVIGLTSFGKACGVVANPAVYTRVSNYIEWIEGIVWPQ